MKIKLRAYKLDNILPRDTSKKAAKIQFAVYRNLTEEKRFAQTIELSNNLQAIAKSGIKQRHPEYNQQQVVQAYLKLILKKSLFDKIFSGKKT